MSYSSFFQDFIHDAQHQYNKFKTFFGCYDLSISSTTRKGQNYDDYDNKNRDEISNNNIITYFLEHFLSFIMLIIYCFYSFILTICTILLHILYKYGGCDLTSRSFYEGLSKRLIDFVEYDSKDDNVHTNNSIRTNNNNKNNIQYSIKKPDSIHDNIHNTSNPIGSSMNGYTTSSVTINRSRSKSTASSTYLSAVHSPSSALSPAATYDEDQLEAQMSLDEEFD